MAIKKTIVGILSLGCPKNLVDSEQIIGLVEKYGLKITFDVTNCDIAILNTCSFISDAKEESIDMLNELISLKQEGRIKKIVVCGCLPQRYPDGFVDDNDNEVDAYIGNSNLDKIAETIIELSDESESSIIEIPDFSPNYKDIKPRFSLSANFSRYIKIAEGCNHSCSFCVIPEIRGPFRSRTIESVVEEVKGLVDQGLKEAVLVAQDTSFYGYDIYDGQLRLADLIYELDKINGLEWIRTLYMYPRNVTKELVSAYKDIPKLCNYMDLSLQHISNDILKSMRRGITKERIVEIISMLRNEIKDLVLRTTFIVGYPGETYEHFNELLNFVEEMQFDRMGAFIYSEEEGTHANTLPDRVSLKIQKTRFQEIMLLQQDVSRGKNSSLQNKVFKTLIEGVAEDRSGYYFGRSYMDAPEVDGLIYIKENSKISIGNFYDVKITNTEEYDLVGSIV